MNFKRYRPSADPASSSSRSSMSGDIYPTVPGSKPSPQPPPTPNLTGYIAPPPSSEPNKKGSGWRSTISTILLFLLAPLIALSITAFAFQSYQVDGQSMETTLQNNDRLIVNKLPRSISRLTHHAYLPRRGDIIIFNQAGLFDAGGNQEKQLIKRVIALPGERVVVHGGFITIYNKTNAGGFNPDTTGKYKITAPTTSGEVDLTLGPSEIFVCGDNRGNSEDSRAFGPVSLERIVGKLSFRILPLGKAKHF